MFYNEIQNLSYTFNRKEEQMIISKKISSSIAETLSANNIISEQEIPIYSYCLDYIIELFFLFIFAVLYGMFSHKLPETLIFLAVFITTSLFSAADFMHPLQNGVPYFHLSPLYLCFIQVQYPPHLHGNGLLPLQYHCL